MCIAVSLQTVELKKEIEDLPKSLNSDTVDQALREVKEYAARSAEVNVDTLQMKLMHLDEVARRTSHKDRELFSLTLQRFLCHKQHENIGFLITSLLSSPAETKLFEKEHKFLKLHGKDQSGSKNTEGKGKDKKQEVEQPQGVATFPHFFHPMMQFPFRYGYPTFPRPPSHQRRATSARNGPRAGYTGCFKCGDTSHFMATCPKK